MQRLADNCYKSARMVAGLKQIEASDALAISIRALSDYENGAYAVPDDIALAMSRVYGCPKLRVEHLKQNPVFLDLLGDVKASEEMAGSVLTMYKEVGDVMRIFPQLAEETVAKKSLSAKLVKECKEACQSLVTLLAGIKKGTADVGASTVRRG